MAKSLIYNRASACAVLLGFLVLLVLLPAAYAQTTGTVKGSVYDQTGAVIPKADVALINQASNDTRKVISNEAGFFSFPNLVPGTYTLKVSFQGFKTWERNGIIVRPGDIRDVAGINLQVGAAGESVKVEAIAAEVAPVDSGERSAVLTSEIIPKLGLQGRDVTELVRTLPGVAAFGGGGTANFTNSTGYDPTVVSANSGAVGNGFTANGGVFRGGTDLIADGAHVIDTGCNCGAIQTVNADMVSEVKVQTSNFGADSAKGPVVINAIGKSGGQNFHGEARMYARDFKFNALPWEVKAAKLNPQPDRYLYPSGEISGAVPHTNKKLLYYVGYEYYYQALNQDKGAYALAATVPTMSMRSGNFDFSPSGPADNLHLCSNYGAGAWAACASPNGSTMVLQSSINGLNATYAAITGGQIPAAYQDPGGKAIMALIPQPNYDPATAGPYQGFNYVFPVAKNQNGMQAHGRLDYLISDNTKLYGSYNFQRETATDLAHIWWNPTYSVPIPGGFSTGTKSNTLSVNFQHIFSPTLTMLLTGTYATIAFPYRANDPSAWSRAAFNYPYSGYYHTGSERMVALSNGYWVPGYPQMDMPDFFGSDGIFQWKKHSPTFEGNVTKVVGSHMLKFGGYSESAFNGQGQSAYLNGQAYFEPAFCHIDPNDPTTPATLCGNNLHHDAAGNVVGFGTANPVANILLGAPTGYTEDKYNKVTNMSYRTIAGFAQDDWKIFKRLNVQLGVRFDHIGPWHDTDNASGFAVWVPTFYASDIAAGITSPGFRWTSRDPGVPNSGNPSRFAYISPRFGMAYDLFGTGNTVLRGGWGRYRWGEQFNDSQPALQLGHGAQQYTFGGSQNARYLWEIDKLAAAGLAGAAPKANVTGLDALDDERSLTTSYNFTISQKTPWRSLLEVGYVGNSTDNMHILPYSNHGGLSDINVIPMGYTFTGDASRSLTPVCSPLPTCAYNATYDPYRPFGYYNALNVVKHAAYANYNALQVSWQKQTGMLTYNLNYAWSKAMGIHIAHQFGGPVVDPMNMAHNYGVSNIDRSHVFNASYQIDLGRKYSGGNKWLRGAANGWMISGITTLQSGPNLAVSPDDGDGNFYKMDVTPFGLTSTNDAGKQGMLWFGTPDIKVMPVVTCDPTKNLKSHQYINGDCFTLPALPTQNADGTWAFHQGWWQLPYVHGPAYFNSDLTLFKSFKVTEKSGLQFRVSAFNFLNHPLTSFKYDGQTSNGYYTQLKFRQDATGKWTQTNPDFGYASVKTGRRVVELAVKYSF